MSVRKFRLVSKIATGLVTTIVAPVLATVVSQQVDGWQQTLKILVENELPPAKGDWNRPTLESVGAGHNRFTAENTENAEKCKAMLQGIPPRSQRSPR